MLERLETLTLFLTLTLSGIVLLFLLALFYLLSGVLLVFDIPIWVLFNQKPISKIHDKLEDLLP